MVSFLHQFVALVEIFQLGKHCKMSLTSHYGKPVHRLQFPFMAPVYESRRFFFIIFLFGGDNWRGKCVFWQFLLILSIPCPLFLSMESQMWTSRINWVNLMCYMYWRTLWNKLVTEVCAYCLVHCTHTKTVRCVQESNLYVVLGYHGGGCWDCIRCWVACVLCFEENVLCIQGTERWRQFVPPSHW